MRFISMCPEVCLTKYSTGFDVSGGKLHTMKKRINFFKQAVLFLLVSSCLSTLHAQEKEASIKAAVQAKQFNFNTIRVLPASGNTRQVSGEGYNVRLTADSLVSYLPYFGRVYTAPLNNEGGIKFTSTKFDYSVKEKKKGGWEVSVKPKDNDDYRDLLFTVSKDGFATLRIISNNRQPISYQGNVDALH